MLIKKDLICKGWLILLSQASTFCNILRLVNHWFPMHKKNRVLDITWGIDINEKAVELARAGSWTSHMQLVSNKFTHLCNKCGNNKHKTHTDATQLSLGNRKSTSSKLTKSHLSSCKNKTRLLGNHNN